MLAESKREAERILQEARDRAEQIASEQEVVRIAHEQALAIQEEAEGRAYEVRNGAEGYADEIFGTLEANLDKFLVAVKRSRDRLAQRSQTGVGIE